MSNKQSLPLPNVSIYNDDAKALPTPPLLTPSDSELSQWLQEMGRQEAAELARPIQLLGNFKPIQLLVRLKEHALECNGRAALACIDRKNATTVLIWDSEADASLNTLVNLKMAGGWPLGYLTFPAEGGAHAYPEPCDEEELYSLLLNSFARGYADHPQWIAADEMLRVTSLDEYSAWSDKHGEILVDPIFIPDSACTENGQTGEAI
jgi:hypothetical protein